MPPFMRISVRADIKKMSQDLNSFAKRQVPFATSLTLTAVAKKVQAAETANLKQALKKKPTSFTLNAVGVIAARKNTQTASVFVKDIQAKYLAPSEFGGKQVMGNKQALLNPKAVRLDGSHNIPAGTLQALRAQPNVFIARLPTAHGLISGVWQRTGDAQRHVKGSLQLLIRWGEGVEVAPHLGYFDHAEAIIKGSIENEFGKALGKAMATAKP